MLAVPALPQRFEFDTIGAEVVEIRLRRAPGKDRERKAELLKQFEESGCRGGHLAEQPVKDQRLPNVICTLPGSSDSVILVGAHFDHVSSGRGVADNWSGVSLLPTLYESLNSRPRKHTFIFVGFSGEEEGLKGSSFYAKQLTQDQVAKIRAVVNLDTLGLSSTKVWVSRSDPRLVDLLARVAHAMKLSVEGLNVEQLGSSDSESFAHLKIPRIAIHSVTQETLPILHSPRDNLSVIRFGAYYDTYRLLSAYLTYLDSALD